MAFRSKMRITSNNLDCEIKSKSYFLKIKEETSKLLTKVDFERLLDEQKLAFEKYEEKMKIIGHTLPFKTQMSHAVKVRTKELAANELEYKKILDKKSLIQKDILRIVKEADIVKKDVKKAEENLRRIEEKMRIYSAPSTSDYISIKDKLQELEKERKTLNQKIYLLKIKLRNLRSKRRISK